VDFAEAQDNEIKAVMFRWDGDVTIGFGTDSELDLYDASADPATHLVRNSGNRLTPDIVWVAPDGRLVAVQGDTPELTLRDIDLWLGPVRVPPNLPFRPQVPDLTLHL
jgi:hypothetical protein